MTTLIPFLETLRAKIIMENLSDDCLLIIFDYLEPIDKISAACSCHRFAGVICRLIGKEVVDFTRAEERIAPADLTQFLSTYGKFVRRVKIHGNHDWCPSFKDCYPFCRGFSTFVEHCSSSSIEEVDISCLYDRLECDELKTLLKDSTNLRVIKLTWFHPKEERQVSLFHGIQSLHIENSSISGLCLLDATNLIDLSIPFCSEINPKYFKYILENNKKLKKLNIRSCKSLTNKSIDQTLRKHQNIEGISIDIRFFISLRSVSSVLSELPNLKAIAIFDDFCFRSQRNPPIEDHRYNFLFKKLCNSHSRTLKSLELHSWNFSRITDWPPFQNLTQLKLIQARRLTDGLLKKIGKTCRLLKEAHLQDSMILVTDEGLLDFIRASKKLSYLDMGSNVSYSEELILRIGEIRRDMGMTAPLTIAYNRWMFPEDGLIQHGDSTKLLRLIPSQPSNYLTWWQCSN